MAGRWRPRLSEHARTRALQMGLKTKEVKRAFRDHEADYPSDTYPGCRIRVAGRLALPYDPATGVVITVLWRGLESRAEGELKPDWLPSPD